MMRRAMMYLRPGNLYKEFVIEDNKADIGKTGRATADFPHDHTGWAAEGKGRRQADTGRKNILDSGHR